MRDLAVPLEVRRLGEIDYVAAWDLQRELVAARTAGAGADHLLLLTHPSVYTAGKRTRPADRPTDGTPVVDVDRGGLITWHGPGQLVGYPLIKLTDSVGVAAYVAALEQALISLCDRLGVPGTGRVPGRTGVWLPADGRGPERKIAAIGIRVLRGVTMHGFALNCDPDLTVYDRIVPCGLADAGSTSLSVELGRPVPVEEILDAAQDLLVRALNGELPVEQRDIPRQPVAAGVAWHLDPALST